MCPPLPPSQIRSKADSRENGRVGAAETAADAHLHGDSTKKTLDPRDDGTRLVAKADELNHTNMYIFATGLTRNQAAAPRRTFLRFFLLRRREW